MRTSEHADFVCKPDNLGILHINADQHWPIQKVLRNLRICAPHTIFRECYLPVPGYPVLLDQSVNRKEKLLGSRRIILFGATGYTGGPILASLRAKGAAPLLAGRNEQERSTLAARSGGLDFAVADATDAARFIRTDTT